MGVIVASCPTFYVYREYLDTIFPGLVGGAEEGKYAWCLETSFNHSQTPKVVQLQTARQHFVFCLRQTVSFLNPRNRPWLLLTFASSKRWHGESEHLQTMTQNDGFCFCDCFSEKVIERIRFKYLKDSKCELQLFWVHLRCLALTQRSRDSPSNRGRRFKFSQIEKALEREESNTFRSHGKFPGRACSWFTPVSQIEIFVSSNSRWWKYVKVCGDKTSRIQLQNVVRRSRCRGFIAMTSASPQPFFWFCISSANATDEKWWINLLTHQISQFQNGFHRGLPWLHVSL